MPTIYALLACGGLYLDLANHNAALLVSDIGNHVAAISKERYPGRKYRKVFIGYCAPNQPLMVRDYPHNEVQEYVWEAIWKFVSERQAYIMNGLCTYSRPIKGWRAKQEKREQYRKLRAQEQL
jgi:hypothetical protein